MVPPGAPAVPTALLEGDKAIVSFQTPKSTGGSPIEYYTVTASPGGKKATGLGSPILVEGLTPGQAYTFTVTATNGAGTGRAVRAAKAGERSAR
ncbi:MAG: fibronectin type III domain-containing protein [Candidatus Aminicenantes bacterium]|nr:fibronectin type III domain-containing protein [Candidatus Aminicenantes bacterium]